MLSLIDEDFQWQSKLTVKIKTQKAFHRSYSRAFGQSSKIRTPRSLWCPDGYYQKLQAEGSHVATVPSVLGLSRISNRWRWSLLRGKKPKWIFRNLGSLLQPLEFVPDSRKHVVPTEWQVRTVLGDCISKTRVISIQAPQYRQHALISDFLDFTNLSIKEEAALAPNWIKDRPEGLKLQNLALDTVTGPAMSSLPKKKRQTADVQNAIHKCESLGSRKQLILHGNPPAIAQDFFSPHMAVLRLRVFTNMQFECCIILQGTLGGNFDIFAASGVNPLPGCSSGKPVQDLLA